MKQKAGKIQVMKIGGAVLNKPENFLCLQNIIEKFCNRPTVFVFSAFSDLSRKLRQSARLAKNENFHSALNFFNALKNDLNAWTKLLFETPKHHEEVESRLNYLFETYEKILFGIAITKELTPRTLDRVLSFGEYFSSVILEEYLKSKGIGAVFLDAADLIITDTNYGKAKPIIEITREAVKNKLIPLLNKEYLIFLPGFIGSTETKTITTMGFESSNLTALLLASIVGAESVTFWTNVEGIRTSDPKIVQNTLLVPEISFEDVRLASLNGLKLVHPSMFEYFVQNPQIKYIYRSAFAVDDGETKVIKETKIKPEIVLISEPYTFVEVKPETTVEFNRDYNFFYFSNDYSFYLADETIADAKKFKDYFVITILNIDVKETFNAIKELPWKVPFVFSDSTLKITKIFIEPDELSKVANFLHDFLILKNK
ncbi:MAG: hypothetical protein ACPLPX_05560 [Candidatus Kapaibacteriota bacterium]